MEFTYLSLIDETMQELGKACETAGIENWYKLDKDTFKRIEQKINDVNEMGRLKFSDKLFVNYRMSNIFRYTYGAPLLPSYIEGSIFVDTRFEYLNLKDIEFVNCIFIDCIFDCCDMSGCQFKTCEFLNTEMSVMENSNGYKTSFAGCYMRRRIENGRQTDEIGEHVFQPWDDPLSITMRSNNNGTVQSCLLFSGCVGVPTKASFLNTLERDSKGFLCYKRIGGTSYPRPDRWVIENGSFLTENVNSEVLELCERGVNVANWFFAFTQYTDSDLWLCRIRYEDIGDVCVPWSSNGKFRATRVELLHQIRNWKTQLTLTIKEVEKYNRMKIIPALQDEVEGRYNIIHEDYILEVDKSKYQQYLPTWWWDK